MYFKINIILVFIFFLISLSCFSQNIELEPIIIEKDNILATGQFSKHFIQNQFEFFPCFSLEEIPDYFPAVELKKRALSGIQQDLSIRGSIFEDNSVQLEGISINDPQTGHFNLEIPVSSADIESVGLFKNRQAINYKLKAPKDKGTLIKNSFGQHGLWENFLSTNFSYKDIKNRLSIEHKVSSGSRSDTDFEIYNFSFHSLWQEPGKEAEFIFGSTERDFGANSFYAKSFPQEEEHITQRFFLARAKLKKELYDIKSTAYLRRHTDKFILNRHDPPFYANYHTTYIYGIDNKITFKNDTFLGLNLSEEKITSTNLGKHKRLNKGISLGVGQKKIDDFLYQLSAGLNYYKPWGYLEDVHLGLGYYLSKSLLLQFSFDRIWRAPSFTELYYTSPSDVGNSSLNIQSSNNYQLGLKFRPVDNINLSLDFFLRKQSDTIDWVKDVSANPWEAENIGNLTARGFDLYGEAKFENSLLKVLGIGYTYLDLNKNNSFNLSKYVFDYNQHKIIANIIFDFMGVDSNLIVNFLKPASRDKYATADLKLSKQFSNFKLNLEGINIFNQDYQEKIDIKGTGRWYKISLTYNF